MNIPPEAQQDYEQWMSQAEYFLSDSSLLQDPNMKMILRMTFFSGWMCASKQRELK